MEKNKYPESTYAILAYKEFEDTFNYDHAVDWAIDMLQYGYESEHLLMLAGIVKPTDRFECMYYLEAAIEELGLKAASGEVAVIASVWPSLKKLSVGEDIIYHLDVIKNVYHYTVSYDVLFGIYKYYWEWHDIEELCFQCELNIDEERNKIKDFLMIESKEFVEKYRAEIESLLPQ